MGNGLPGLDWTLRILLDAWPGIAFALWGIAWLIVSVGTLLILLTPDPVNILPRLKKKLSPVTLLKPLKGLDTALEENLMTCFEQDHPTFEILFCVADPHDPVVPLVKKLLKKYPLVDAQLLTVDSAVGVNPKINNVIQGYDQAKYPLIWIMDSNVQVGSQAMSRSAALFEDSKIGLVHHLPVGIRPESLGSILEAGYLNTTHSKMYTFLNFLAVDSCVNGKSNMYRKSDLESLGGLSFFGKYLAEDNVIGQAVMRIGLKHAMTPDLALQPLGNMSLTTYLKRRIRWIRVRKYTVSVGTLYEPFTECLLSGLIGSMAFLHYFNTPPLLFLAYHIAFWLLCDTLVTAKLESGLYRPWAYLFAWIVKEIGAVPLWIMAMLGTTVVWRGQPYHLNPDGTVFDGTQVEPSRWRLALDGWMDWWAPENGNASSASAKRRSPKSKSSPRKDLADSSPRRSGRVHQRQVN